MFRPRVLSVPLLLITLLTASPAALAARPRFWKVEAAAPTRAPSGVPITIQIAMVPTQGETRWMTGAAPLDAAQIEATITNLADGKSTRIHLANGVADDQRAPLRFNPITN